jgi:hypothetical protein
MIMSPKMAMFYFTATELKNMCLRQYLSEEVIVGSLKSGKTDKDDSEDNGDD